MAFAHKKDGVLIVEGIPREKIESVEGTLKRFAAMTTTLDRFRDKMQLEFSGRYRVYSLTIEEYNALHRRIQRAGEI